MLLGVEGTSVSGMQCSAPCSAWMTQPLPSADTAHALEYQKKSQRQFDQSSIVCLRYSSIFHKETKKTSCYTTNICWNNHFVSGQTWLWKNQNLWLFSLCPGTRPSSRRCHEVNPVRCAEDGRRMALVNAAPAEDFRWTVKWTIEAWPPDNSRVFGWQTNQKKILKQNDYKHQLLLCLQLFWSESVFLCFPVCFWNPAAKIIAEIAAVEAREARPLCCLA